MSSGAPVRDEILEAAFTIRAGMRMETRQAANDLPPVITLNGRLRLQFESVEVWLAFAKEVLMIEALCRQYRDVNERLPITVTRL